MADVTLEQPVAPRMTPALALRDTAGVAKRNLLRIARTPLMLVVTAVQPALLLVLFRYVLVGFRFHSTTPRILAGMALIIAFGYAFSWMYAAVGLATKDPETAQIAGILPFFV